MKDSITTKELISLLSKMKGGASNRNILKEVDPEHSEEYAHFLMMQATKRVENGAAGSYHSIAAELLEEELMNGEKVSITNAIELLQWGEFNRGADHILDQTTSMASNNTSSPSKLVELIKKIEEVTGKKVNVLDFRTKKE